MILPFHTARRGAAVEPNGIENPYTDDMCLLEVRGENARRTGYGHLALRRLPFSARRIWLYNVPLKPE